MFWGQKLQILNWNGSPKRSRAKTQKQEGMLKTKQVDLKNKIVREATVVDTLITKKEQKYRKSESGHSLRVNNCWMEKTSETVMEYHIDKFRKLTIDWKELSKHSSKIDRSIKHYTARITVIEYSNKIDNKCTIWVRK